MGIAGHFEDSKIFLMGFSHTNDLFPVTMSVILKVVKTVNSGLLRFKLQMK